MKKDYKSRLREGRDTAWICADGSFRRKMQVDYILPNQKLLKNINQLQI